MEDNKEFKTPPLRRFKSQYMTNNATSMYIELCETVCGLTGENKTADCLISAITKFREHQRAVKAEGVATIGLFNKLLNEVCEKMQQHYDKYSNLSTKEYVDKLDVDEYGELIGLMLAFAAYLTEEPWKLTFEAHIFIAWTINMHPYKIDLVFAAMSSYATKMSEIDAAHIGEYLGRFNKECSKNVRINTDRENPGSLFVKV